MAIPSPPPGSPFFFAREYGLVICREHRTAVLVSNINRHLRVSHPHDTRSRSPDVRWAHALPNVIRTHQEYSTRQPWKMRRAESSPLPYLPVQSGGYKCRQPDCGSVYTRGQESGIRKHCLEMHGLQSLPGILPYVKDVQYQSFNPAYTQKDGGSHAFGVGATATVNQQPKRDPGYTELEFEPLETIGQDQPFSRPATKAEGSSPRDGAPQSNLAEHNRSRHSNIDSDEPSCVRGRNETVRESRTSLKRKREAAPIKDEDSDDSDDSANSDSDDSGSDEETSTHSSTSVSLGGAAANAGSLCSAGMTKPRQYTTEASVERVGPIQQTYKEEFVALQHELQVNLAEIVQLKEQLHERTGELDQLLAKEATTKDECQKAKNRLSAAEEQHKAKEKEWASQRNDTNRATSQLQNKLTENGKKIHLLESKLSVQKTQQDTLRRQVKGLQNHNIYLERTLDERGNEIRALQSQLKSTEASAVAKSLEEANAALKVAQKLNDDYKAQMSGLKQDIKMRGEAILERTAEVMEKAIKIGELEEELKRERARFPEERRAIEVQLPHEPEEPQKGCRSVTAEHEERKRTWGPMGEEGSATESRLRPDADLATRLQEAKDLQAKAEEAAHRMAREAAKSKRKAAKKREKVKELKKRLQEKEEQLARREQEVCSLAGIVKRRSTPTHKPRSKRVKRETTTLSPPPLSAQPEYTAPTEGW